MQTITSRPAEQPVAPKPHKVNIASREVYFMGVYTGNYNHRALCRCGWVSQETGSSSIVNTWAAEHERAEQFVGVNPMVTITNDMGEIEHMRRDVFEQHYQPFGWRITAKPSGSRPGARPRNQ